MEAEHPKGRRKKGVVGFLLQIKKRKTQRFFFCICSRMSRIFNTFVDFLWLQNIGRINLQLKYDLLWIKSHWM